MPSSDYLSGLIKLVAKEPWRGAFEEQLEHHIASVLDEYDIQNFDELGGLIGAHWAMTLWGCAFEDFLTKDVEGAGNIVDDYLKRRGWKESASKKAYMLGLKETVMSLYEISDIEPGQSFLARDLIRGGPKVLVSERTATKTLKPWDRLAMRIVKVRGENVIGGGLLPIEPEPSDILISMFGDSANGKSADIATVLDRFGIYRNDPDFARLVSAPSNRAELLQNLAPIFSLYFLDDLIEGIVNPSAPDILNSDGEDLEFMRLVYRLADGVSKARVRAALNQAPSLEVVSKTLWNWLEPRKTNRQNRKEEVSQSFEFVTTTERDSVVLGTIELKSTRLELCVNSEGSAERGREMLEPMLDKLVSTPLMERQTLEQAIAEHNEFGSDSAPPDLTFEEQLNIIHASMDNYYRAQLDQPIPSLGNISPRKAAQSKKGRDKLVAWLKLLENRTAKHDADHPMATYDATWIWEELGVLDLRK